jgi:DNA-binding HxlR family transcriptional regulator
VAGNGSDGRSGRNCEAVNDVLSTIGDKWTVLVVMTLSHGSMRFNELRRRIGDISQRMLTLTLRRLERKGLVSRTVQPTVPPRVDYALTELGKTLIGPITAVAEWAIEHREEVEDAEATFDAVQQATTEHVRPIRIGAR